MRKYLCDFFEYLDYDWKKNEITQFLYKILLQVEFIKLKVFGKENNTNIRKQYRK